MAMPSLTSIMFGTILASIMIIGMSNFFVGTYESYNTNETLLYGDTPLNTTHENFMTRIGNITNVFQENPISSALSWIPGIGGLLNVGANALWSLGLFIIMPAQLATLIGSSFAGTSVIIPPEVAGTIGIIFGFILIAGIIRVLTQRGEI